MSGIRKALTGGSPTTRLVIILAAAVVIVAIAVPGVLLLGEAKPPAVAPGRPPLPTEANQRALIGGDAHRVNDGPCKGVFEFTDAQGGKNCTHGAEVSDETPGDVAGAPPPADPLPCIGDGTSGNRVQAVYAYPADKADHYATMVPLIRTAAAHIEWVFKTSAAKTGGERHVRWVTDATCVLNVLKVQLPVTGDDSFTTTINDMIGLGHTRADRKYLIFMDSGITGANANSGICGIGQIWGDTTPGQTNQNNGARARYARVDNYPWPTCWDWNGNHSTAAHELMHNLGGVQNNAPHTSGGWHCVDESDTMCYSDSPNYPAMLAVCAASEEQLLDCRNDDYFAANPAAGSYLTQYWNTASSSFLEGALVPIPNTTIASKPATPTNVATSTFTMTATVAGATFECSLDNAAYAACTSPASYANLADGSHTFGVRARTAGGVDATPATATWVVDRTAPVFTTQPFYSIANLQMVNATTVPLSIRWAATDAGSGIVSYELRQDTGKAGTFPTAITLDTLTSTAASVSGTVNGTYAWRVRARDAAGNVSAWQTGPNVLIALYNETNGSFSYSSGWSNGTSTSYIGGADKYSSTTNAKGTFVAGNARNVAWVTYKSTARGQARVLIDGVDIGSILNTYSATAVNRAIVMHSGWLNPNVNHTFVVSVYGTAGHPRVDIDAFIVLHDAG